MAEEILSYSVPYVVGEDMDLRVPVSTSNSRSNSRVRARWGANLANFGHLDTAR